MNNDIVILSIIGMVVGLFVGAIIARVAIQSAIGALYKKESGDKKP